MNKSLIFLAYGGLFSLGLVDNSRGPFYPILLRDFGLGTAAGSMFFSLTSLAALLTTLTAQWWAPKFSSLGLLRTSLTMMIVSTWAMAWIMGTLGPFSLMLIAAFILGVSFSGIAVAQNLLCLEGAHKGDRRRVLSGLHANYGLSSLLAPLLLNFFWLQGLHHLWHFLFISFFAFIILLASYALPASRKHISVERKRGAPCPWGERLLWGAHLAFYVGGEVFVSSRLVSYLLAKGFSMEMANVYLSFFFGLLMCGRIFFAFVRPPLGNWPMLFVSLMLTLLCLGLGVGIHPIGLVLSGLTMSYYFPYSMDALQLAYPHHLDFMTSSVMTFVGLALLLMHDLVGRLAQVYGIERTFLIAPLFTVLSLMALLVHLVFLTKKGRAD